MCTHTHTSIHHVLMPNENIQSHIHCLSLEFLELIEVCVLTWMYFNEVLDSIFELTFESCLALSEVW